MIVIGDIHGCFLTMKALIKKAKEEFPDDQICLVGDLIDRGPRSRQVIEYVIKNNILCVKGNHEQMCIDAGKSPSNSYQWESNGGINCLDSYRKKVKEEMADGEISTVSTLDIDTLNKHREWMDKLPIYLEFKDCKRDDGRYLVVSHSTVGGIWDWSDEKKEIMKDMMEQHVLWNRHHFEDRKEIYNVIGHTPCDPPKIKSFYANIDTGACFARRGVEILGQIPSYGIMTALQFPSMKVFKQENID